MKWILIVAYYLVSPGTGSSDVHVKVYPDYFHTVEQCEFMKDLVREKYSEYQSTDVQCYGVDK